MPTLFLERVSTPTLFLERSGKTSDFFSDNVQDTKNVATECELEYTPTTRGAGTLRFSEDFERLSDEWERDRPRGVDITEMVMHPVYQRIIGMGPRAIPLLLARLEKNPGHWFWALHAITQAEPVPPESFGNLKGMAAAWLAWGKSHGYRW